MSKSIKRQAAEWIKREETKKGKFEPMPYPDQGGIMTVGYGSLVSDHPGATYPITEETAMQWLEDDVDWAYDTVNTHVKTDLNENQMVALMSLVYNIGSGNFAGDGKAGKPSTLLNLINAGDYGGAAEQFKAWNKYTIRDKKGNPILDKNGRKIRRSSKGLTARRLRERDLFQAYSETSVGQSIIKESKIDKASQGQIGVGGAGLGYVGLKIANAYEDHGSLIDKVLDYGPWAIASILAIALGWFVMKERRNKAENQWV